MKNKQRKKNKVNISVNISYCYQLYGKDTMDLQNFDLKYYVKELLNIAKSFSWEYLMFK